MAERRLGRPARVHPVAPRARPRAVVAHHGQRYVAALVVDLLPASLGIGERAALADFVRFVRDTFGERVRDLRLFGSRARGEGHEESDLDVLVAIDQLNGAERTEIWNCTGRLFETHGVDVGAFTLSSQRWDELRSLERRIAQEIERDGIRL